MAYSTRGNPVHGMYGSPAHKTWQSIKSRKRQNPYYKDVFICEKWLRFEGFYEDMGDRPEGWSIDRIDNSLGYFKENCKWSNKFEQARNKRNNKNLTARGETKCLNEWASISGV
jgi:hypothetical protein